MGDTGVKISNYEIAKQQAQKLFLTFEQEKMIQKFRLRHDPNLIYIDFLRRTYRIDRGCGLVVWSDNENDFTDTVEAGFNEAMTIYDILCYSREDWYLSEEFIEMKNLSSIRGGSAPLGNSLFQKFEKFFDHRDDVLSRACEKLGGIRAGRGDVAYQLPMFTFFPVLVQFWNSDEEFPASLQIFVDKNALQFMHFETLWYAASHLLERLKEEMCEKT